jgi:hypothetical protein
MKRPTTDLSDRELNTLLATIQSQPWSVVMRMRDEILRRRAAVADRARVLSVVRAALSEAACGAPDLDRISERVTDQLSDMYTEASR